MLRRPLQRPRRCRALPTVLAVAAMGVTTRSPGQAGRTENRGPATAAREEAMASIQQSLVLHYTFQDGPGSSVRDRSGRGNQGTVEELHERVLGHA